MDVFLSVIIPAYNEESHIGKTLISAHDYLSQREHTYEIVVVDDGSRDGTAGVVKDLQETIGNLSVISIPRNRGKGHAVKKGMLSSRGQYRLFMDADNSTAIDHWDMMRRHFQEGYDIVVGSRAVKGSKIIARQPYYKIALGKLGNLIIQCLLLPGIWDSQCGFKAFTAKSAQEIFSRVEFDGFSFDVEALLLARRMGYGIKEMPVTWIDSHESRVRSLDYLIVLRDVLRLRFSPRPIDRK